MKKIEMLSDFEHPDVKAKACDLISGESTMMDKLKCVFSFVRDGIPFGFPPRLDSVKASETLIDYQIGNCDTKATLFNALCRSIDIPTRIHTSLINLEIMVGVFPSYVFPILPKSGSHSWIEVKIDDEWESIDSYINDKPYYEAALKKLQQSGKTTGYSISHAKGLSSCEFNFGEKGYMHMGAVIEDHGTWQDYSEYMASAKYKPLNPILVAMFPLMAKIANKRIKRIRSS